MTILRVSTDAVIPAWANLSTPSGQYAIIKKFRDGTSGPVSIVTTDRDEMNAGSVYLRFLPPETPDLVKAADLEARLERELARSDSRARSALEAMQFDADNNEFCGRGNW
jgi:hypothetical protein